VQVSPGYSILLRPLSRCTILPWHGTEAFLPVLLICTAYLGTSCSSSPLSPRASRAQTCGHIRPQLILEHDIILLNDILYAQILTSARIRRIRCDARRPDCRNCTYTGRTCDGVKDDRFVFVDPGSGRKSLARPNSRTPVAQPYDSPLPSPPSPREHDEVVSFNTFLVRAAPLFSSGGLDSIFWEVTVPQLSHSIQ
jgi:hypothetical protein